jgi:digeranylgeranylglycerophospholipid reductase
MDYYDVVIIGCGPGGGQCARELTKKGVKVLIVEKARDFATNNFSSGGVPLSVLKDYSLPDSIVGSYWNQLTVHSSYRKEEWKQKNSFGAILEFRKLREFLAEEVASGGGTVSLDTAYVDHWEQNDCLIVKLRHHDATSSYTVRTKVLVDATGTERVVLAKTDYDKEQACVATGIEYLIQVPESVYSTYANTMSLFLGHRWMPQGYGWVFPMNDNHLKVGIIRYFSHDTFIPYNKSYKFYLDHLIETVTGSKEPNIIDKHGKTVHYTYGRKDIHYKDTVIAIGDAISTINPLACEGIRHALYSGQLAHQYILEKLTNSGYSFAAYQKALEKYCSYKWTLSEWIMKKVYRFNKDKYYDMVIDSFHQFTPQEMMEFAFDYKLSKVIKFSFSYYAKKFKMLFS